MADLVLDPSLESRFEVLKTLRQSAGGAALRVREHPGGATKILETRRTQVPETRLAEARRLLDLRRGDLARLEEVGRSENGVYWLRQDLGDVTVESVLEGGALPVPLALELVRQALEALDPLHDLGGCVRNLSPADLAVVRGGEAPHLVLTDLGLGHGLAPDHVPAATTVFVGRLRYASPEQFEDPPKAGPENDVYAVGLIAYQLLTGRFPIAGESMSSLIAGHLFRPPLAFDDADPEGRVPEPVRDFVLRLLAKAPAERGDAQDAIGRLGALASSAGPVDFSPLEAFLAPVAETSSVDLEAVEEALEAGELAEARRRLEAQRAANPGETEIAEMARRLAAVESFTHAAEVHRLVTTAQQRLDAGSPASAVGHLEEAQRLVPDDPEVAGLLDTARGAMRRSGHSRSFSAERPEKPAHDEATGDTHTARADQLLDEARERAEAEDFPAAKDAIRRALALAPDHPEALPLLASIDALVRIQSEEAREQQALERTVTGIRQLLDDGREQEARRDLDAATERFGDHEDLGTLRFDLTKARLDGEVSRTVALSPEQLQAALAAETAPKQSPEPAATTMQMPAKNIPTVAKQAQDAPAAPQQTHAKPVETKPVEAMPATTQPIPKDALDRARHGQSPRPADSSLDVRSGGGGSVTLPMEAIEAAKQRALDLRAEQQTPETPAHAPPAPPPESASPPPTPAGLGSVTLPMAAVDEARKRVEAQRPPPPSPVSTAPPLPPPPVEPPPASRAEPTATRPAPTSPSTGAWSSPASDSGQAATPTPTPTPSSGAAGPPGSSTFSLDELGFGHGEPEPAPRPGTGTASTRAAPPSRGTSRPLVAAGVLLVLASVFAASFFLSGHTDQLPLTPEPEPAVTAEDLPPGLLEIDASPWAEIQALTGAGGEEVPVVGAPYTPKLLPLPPGTYTVAVVHPPTGESKKATFEIESGGVQKVRVSFEISVEEVFRRAGW